MAKLAILGLRTVNSLVSYHHFCCLQLHVYYVGSKLSTYHMLPH